MQSREGIATGIRRPRPLRSREDLKELGLAEVGSSGNLVAIVSTGLMVPVTSRARVGTNFAPLCACVNPAAPSEEQI